MDRAKERFFTTAGWKAAEGESGERVRALDLRESCRGSGFLAVEGGGLSKFKYMGKRAGWVDDLGSSLRTSKESLDFAPCYVYLA